MTLRDVAIRTYSPRAEDGERPCGDQYGTHAGAARHQRAVAKLRKVGGYIPAGVALASCGGCAEAERQHQRELYEARKTARAASRTPRR